MLKTIAIIGVLLIHVSSSELTHPIGSTDWFSALLYGCLARASVPLFLMCSGALMFDKDRQYPVRKILTHNLPHILIALFFWAFIYQLYNLIINQTLTLPSVLNAVKQTIAFHHEGHLYYLHMMILVYLFVPVTRIFTSHATKRLLEYSLLLWFCFGILFPAIKNYWPFTLLYGIPLQYELNMTWSAIGYGVFGHYLDIYPFKRRWLPLVMWAAGFLMVFCGTAIFSIKENELYTAFLEGMSPGVAIMAAGIFGTVKGLRPEGGRPDNSKISRISFHISRASFCIYLVHLLFIHIFQRHGYTAAMRPTLLSIPVFSLIVFALSYIVYFAFSYIPGVRKWLI